MRVRRGPDGLLHGHGHRLVAGLLLGLSACQGPEQVLTLQAVPRGCRRPAASEVRISLLGDFPPQVLSDGAPAAAMTVRRDRGGARSVSVEGLAQDGTLVSLGWTGPLPPAGAAEQLPVPVYFGPPDTLCPQWNLLLPRALHQATALPGGQVMVSGGIGPEGPTDTMELYDPDQPLVRGALPLLANTAVGHTLTVLSSGLLLVVGGVTPQDSLPATAASMAARVYRPTGELVNTYPMPTPRALHAAVRINDTQVWIGGGCASVDRLLAGQAPTCAASAVLRSWLVFDEQEPGFVAAMGTLAQPRYGHQVVPLGGGRLVVTGGTAVLDGKLAPTLDAEIVEPQAPDAIGARVGSAPATAAALPGGGVLWTGTEPTVAPYAGVLLPSLDGNMPAEELGIGAPAVPRAGATLTVLPDGAALLAGGRDLGGAATPTVELFEGQTFRPVLGTFAARVGHAAVPLPDGTVLLLGGFAASGAPSAQAARFVHSLRLPDATPPPWPLPADEALRWLTARRPGALDLDADRSLWVRDPGLLDDQRPAEWALFAGVRWAGGHLQARVNLADPSAAWLALILGYRSDASYLFVQLQQGQPVALHRVAGAVVAEIPGCRGAALGAGELETPTALSMDWRDGQLMIGVAGQERLRCKLEPERGAVGIGATGSDARIQDLALVRGS